MDISITNKKFEQRRETHNIQFTPKKEQLEIITHLGNKKNVTAFLPTGFGKSFCIAAPTILSDRDHDITLVISPLVALMDEQVSKIKEYNMSSAKLGPDIEKEELTRIKNGDMQFVFCSPETALKREWKDVFLTEVWQERVSLLVIDEAHCVSDWGDNFRPDYRNLDQLRSIFTCPLLVLTATTTKKVKDDIIKYLNIKDDFEMVSLKPDRPNIFIDVVRRKDGIIETLAPLLDHIVAYKARCKKTLIFCRSVNSVSETYLSVMDYLGESAYIDGIRHREQALVHMFHKSTDEDSKVAILRNFSSTDGSTRCLIATAALGMGIDIRDIDVVLHFGTPRSVISYWQEVGRCARDGRPGYAQAIIDGITLAQKNTEKEISDIMKNKANTCFRKAILDAFEGTMPDLPVSTCDRDCVTTCTCQNCKCCVECKKLCNCDKTINFGLKVFFGR